MQGLKWLRGSRRADGLPGLRKAIGWFTAWSLVGRFTAVFALVTLILMLVAGFLLSRYLVNAVTDQAKAHLAHEAEVVASRVATRVSLSDLEAPLTGERYTEFETYLQTSALPANTKRIKVWNRTGMVVFSDNPGEVGNVYPPKEELQQALQGETASELSGLQAIENAGERRFGRLLEVYTPLRLPGSSDIQGAFEVYQDYSDVEMLAAKIGKAINIGVAAMVAFVYVSTIWLVKRGSDTIKRRQDERDRTFKGTLHALGSALDARDSETEGHSTRVAEMAVAVGKEMGLSWREMDRLEKAALLHDVGKIGVPDAILRKPGPLTEDEWAQMRRHPAIGRNIVRNIPFLEDVAEIVLSHHERFDGGGYPRGLRGDGIPLGARIFAVVDTYDAITCDRPYRKARSPGTATQEIITHSGQQFDPEVVTAFLRVLEHSPTSFRPPVATLAITESR